MTFLLRFTLSFIKCARYEVDNWNFSMVRLNKFAFLGYKYLFLRFALARDMCFWHGSQNWGWHGLRLTLLGFFAPCQSTLDRSFQSLLKPKILFKHWVLLLWIWFWGLHLIRGPKMRFTHVFSYSSDCLSYWNGVFTWKISREPLRTILYKTFVKWASFWGLQEHFQQVRHFNP